MPSGNVIRNVNGMRLPNDYVKRDFGLLERQTNVNKKRLPNDNVKHRLKLRERRSNDNGRPMPNGNAIRNVNGMRLLNDNVKRKLVLRERMLSANNELTRIGSASKAKMPNVNAMPNASVNKEKMLNGKEPTLNGNGPTRSGSASKKNANGPQSANAMLNGNEMPIGSGNNSGSSRNVSVNSASKEIRIESKFSYN